MSNFFVALYAVLPMFIMLAIGFTVRKMKVIEEAHLPVLNKIVFNVFFPFLMFNNIYAFDLSADFNASLLLYAVVAVAVIYGLSVGFALIFEKSNKSRGALIQAIYRSNFVLMGLPIVGNIFGSGRLGMTSMLVTVIVPMYNILAVITLGSIMVKASETDTRPYLKKYYTSVEVTSDDTLWSLEADYNNGLEDRNTYINNIMQLNNMTSDTIITGNHLLLYYYSSEHN
mgnify:FL=1